MQGRYELLSLRIPEPFVVHLREQTQNLLDAAGIVEPLQWEPPLSWIPELKFPGPELNTLPLDRLWDRIRERIHPKNIGAEFGTSIEHIRAVADLHPVPETSRRPHPQKIPRAELPSPDTIASYYTSGVRLHGIAVISGCSRGTIRRVCANSGVMVNRPGRQYSIKVDPSWLRHEYEVKERSLPEIADEIGTSSTNLTRQAIAAGITVRSGARRTHPLARHGDPTDFPPGIWAAFSGQGAQLRVQRFIGLMGHRSLTEAARKLGTTHARLGTVIGHLERATDSQLVERDSRGRRTPTATAVGQDFILAAGDALRLL